MKGKLVMAVAATVALAGCGATKVATATSTPESNSATKAGTTSTRRPQGPGVPKSGRCGDISVNEHTSCAFAHVVVREYDAHPSSTFLAHSPITGLTYTMRCRQALGVVACDNGGDSTLAFSGSPAQTPAQSETPVQTAPPTEMPGSASHASDDEFCSTHECIENFPNGNGTIVQCADGEWSHSGGLSGACSDHGGEE